jgi:enoyl-CoA hydratase/carnithine racemase
MPAAGVPHRHPASPGRAEAALDAYGTVDSEVAAWIRAVVLEGERFTGANASDTGLVGEDSPHSGNSDHLTTKELADELRCTSSNIRDLVRRGRLTPVRRQPMLFTRSELDRHKSRRKSA